MKIKILLPLIALLWCLPAHATWTKIQSPSTGGCNSPCAVPTSATAAGNLLIYLVSGGAGVSISSVTAGACNVAWVHAPSSNISVAAFAALDIFYCTNATASNVSISATLAGTCSATCVGFVLEGHSTLQAAGGTIAIDSGATPSGTINDSTACGVSGPTCPGVALTLSGNSDFIGVISADGSTATTLTGTGFTSDSVTNGNGQGHGITTGSVTAPLTWTQSPNGILIGSAAAFQETAAVATVPRRSLLGVGQ